MSPARRPALEIAIEEERAALRRRHVETAERLFAPSTRYRHTFIADRAADYEGDDVRERRRDHEIDFPED